MNERKRCNPWGISGYQLCPKTGRVIFQVKIHEIIGVFSELRYKPETEISTKYLVTKDVEKKLSNQRSEN